AEGKLQPLPDSFTTSADYHWRSLLPLYREHAVVWGGKRYGVPPLGESLLCCYRKDWPDDPTPQAALAAQAQRKPAAPPTGGAVDVGEGRGGGEVFRPRRAAGEGAEPAAAAGRRRRAGARVLHDRGQLRRAGHLGGREHRRRPAAVLLPVRQHDRRAAPGHGR